MKNLTLEQILVLLLFILVPLLNWLLVQLLAKRRAAIQAAAKRSIPPVPFGAEKTPLAPKKTPVMERVIPGPTRRTPPPHMRYPTTRLLLRNKREVRRGIILMTILGPSRAREPPE
jgi:hypothetical protein